MAPVDGKRIPDPGFGDDDGSADPAVVAALVAHAASLAGTPPERAAAERAVLDALAASRVLTPVVAVPAEPPADAPQRQPQAQSQPDQPHQAAAVAQVEKRVDMAVPTLLAADGRRSLPVFTSVAALARWRADARPVPLATRMACRAALAEGADTLLVDPAGPAPFTLSGAPLRALAEGRPPLAPEQDPEVLATVERLAGAVAGVRAVRVRPGGPAGQADQSSDLTAAIEVADDPASPIAEVARAVAERLAADELLRSRLVRGVALAVLPAAAPNTRLTG